jgi:hypothetical protein
MESSSTRSGTEFIVEIPTVDCEQQIKHSTLIYRCLSVVACKEKLRLDFLDSYNSVGDGHFVVIDRVEKVLEEILFSKISSHSRLDMLGR